MSFHQAPEAYNPEWPEIFKAEACRLSALNTGSILSIEHIGSTSVAGLMAKPVIDILIQLKRGSLDSLISPLEKMEYISKGENGIPGRSYFSRKDGSVHIHCFEEGHPDLNKHISFRNYLRAHSKVRDEYEALKKSILSEPEMTRERYQEQKDDFLNRMSLEAIRWHEARPKPEKLVKKVVIYGLRKRNGQREVLVFDHVQYPEVSPQVPSGTVEEGEDLLVAAQREFVEESGASIESMKFLGSYVYFKQQNQQFQERNIFVVGGEHLPEKWIHKVRGDGEDKNMEFSYHWLPVSVAQFELKGNFGDGLKFFKI